MVEIKNEVTVTRREEDWNFGERNGKNCQGTCLKDTQTKPRVDRIMGVSCGCWCGRGWEGKIEYKRT